MKVLRNGDRAEYMKVTELKRRQRMLAHMRTVGILESPNAMSHLGTVSNIHAILVPLPRIVFPLRLLPAGPGAV